MKLHYMGKFSGNEEDLPKREHAPGAVPFREVKDSKELAVIANGLATGILLAGLLVLWLRSGRELVPLMEAVFPGAFLSLLTMFPHEILHGLCFRGDVYLYTNLKQGMCFVVGPEDMTRSRFVFMSLLPSLVFGLIPFLAFLICPRWMILGAEGAFALSMGAGDYYNVFNALTQMPRDGLTYLHGFHSYWYLPKPPAF